VALTGLGNIKSAAWIAIAVGIIDTAGRLLVPSFGAFIVYLFLIGMMIWRNELSPAGR
jgi:branched-chain amino acid transport system permease protein